MGVFAVILIGAGVASSDWRVVHSAVTATPPPKPTSTPCRVLYVADNGTTSCFRPQPFGVEPAP